MPKIAKKTNRKSRREKKNAKSSASTCLPNDIDSSSSWDGESAKNSRKKPSNKRKRTQTKTSKKRTKKQSKNKSKDDHGNASAVENLTTPDKTKSKETMEPDLGYLSDDEEALYGPCGDPTFGQDAPPARFRKLIGDCVTLEFEVENHENLVLFTGVVQTYDQSTDEFAVRVLI